MTDSTTLRRNAFDPLDWAELARELVEADEPPEAECRTAIGRLYYAAHMRETVTLDTLGLRANTRDAGVDGPRQRFPHLELNGKLGCRDTG